MVKAVRNSNIQALLPFDKINDNTAELLSAIQHAEIILGWYEHLPSEEIPPNWMWAFSDELEEWFEEVSLARKSKYGLADDDWDGMVQNEWDGD